MNKPRLCLVNDTSGENHTGCNLVISAFKAAASAYGMEMPQTLTRRQIVDGARPEDVDLVVINGEGSLHHESNNTDFFPVLLEALDRPAILTNSIWQEAKFMDDALWEHFARKVNLATFRERRSLTAFAYDAHDTPAESVPRLLWPDMSFWWAADVAGIRKVQMVNGQMQDAPQQPKYKLAFSDELPLNAHTRFAGMAEKGEALYVPLRPAEGLQGIVRKLKQCRRYATARFHGACLALMCGTEIEAWPTPSKTHKIDGLLEDVGEGSYEDFTLQAHLTVKWGWLNTVLPLAKLAAAGRLK